MLSEALRLIRVFHDLKQIELAEKLDISRSYLSELEKGKKDPSMDVIQKYSDFFSIPPSSILFFSENLNTEKNMIKGNAKNYVATKIIDFLKIVERKTERV